VTRQPDLFGTEAYARNTDPQSSHDAARKMSFSNKERMVYEVLAATGTRMTSLCITRYLQDAAKQSGDTFAWSVSPRLAPLERKNAIERVGKMPVLNSSGNIANLTAWRVKKKI
jgi:hypothetical protein